MWGAGRTGGEGELSGGQRMTFACFPFGNSTLVGWLVGFLTSSSTTRLYRGRAPRQSV